MSYLVFARKLRPQSFEEIIGQEPIVRTLQNAISQNRIAHAYLFSGIRGVGKTTTARILAKALNCQEGPTPQPCNKCDSCREISAGSSVDVYEIDAASNRGIDEARELRENVRYAPARGKYKVYIIDESHMLTTPAFNALLKTLEEPPSHVVFVLCTTDYHKIPPTIISRCQHFDFRRIPHKQIVENLKAVAKMEGIEISDPSLHLIALSSEGSLRDAQSTLDQLISFSGKKVPHSEVVSLIGIIDRELLIDISADIIEKNPARILKLVDKLIDYGYDPYQFLYELITHFRHMLVIKISPTPQELVNLPEEEFRSISKQASQLTQQELIRFLNVLTQAEPLLKFSPQPRFLLEATLIKLVHLSKLTPIEEVITHLEELTERRTPTAYPPPMDEVREEAPPLSFAKEEEIQKRTFVQFFHAKEGIRDTIIGIVTNMLLNSEDVDSSVPLLGFAYTENGDVKVSARATQALIDKGLNLSSALKHAAKELNGVGGGHDIAAGATIPKGKEEEFLEIVEKEIKNQLVL